VTGEVYDYMIGLFIVGVIFVSAALVVPNLSYVNLLYVDQQQLRNIALETLKTMLLDTGYPVNWGSWDPFDQDDVQRFGLASSGSSSFYVLDSDKVQRLVEDNPLGSMQYDKIRELMGLNGYGFSVRVIPAFNVTWTKNSEVDRNLNFTIGVSLHDGRPTPGAIVDATIVYMTEKANEATLHFDYIEGISTDILGKCTIVETLDVPPGEELKDIIVVFEATVADVATVIATYQKSTEFARILKIVTVGENVTLTIPPDEQPNDARWVDNLIVFSGDLESGFEAVSLHNGTRSNDDKLTWGLGYKVWERSFKDLKRNKPIILIGNIWSVQQEEGRRSHLVMSPSLQGYSLYYGCSEPSGTTVTVDRNVIISGMTYLVEMILWKEIL